MRDIARYPVSSIISLAPLVLIPVASALFFIKKRSGWILLTGCVTFLTISIGLLFVKSLNYSSRSYGELHSMFPRPSLMSLLIPLAILISTLFFLCKTEVKEIFKISKNHVLSTIVISGLISVLLLLES
ncbi:MAG: hypothetical protein ABUL44_03725 [Flavobacterium sp.]